MKALVTGATGFLGGNLAKRLRQEGHEVTLLGRNPKKLEALASEGFRAQALNLESAVEVAKIEKDYDWVFHCAALSSPWGTYQDFYKANVLASQNLFEHFTGTNLRRFVYVSTPSIYVGTSHRENIRETENPSDLNVNFYIKTKKEVELLADEYFKKGLPIISIRPQGLIGKGDPSIFPRIVKAIQRGILPVIDDANTKMDLTPIESVVESMICAAKCADEFLGEKYNISNGDPIDLYSTLRKTAEVMNKEVKWKKMSFNKAFYLGRLLEKICYVLPGRPEPPLSSYTACVFGRSRTLCIEKAQKELGYQPAVSMDQALTATFDRIRSGDF